MRFRKPRLRFLLDEGAPDAVGKALEAGGHKVLYANRGMVVPRGSTDIHVSAAAILNDAILVAVDGDMKVLARGHGVGGAAFAKLNLLKISCAEPEAATRVEAAISLIEHEWVVGEGRPGRRLFVELRTSVMSTNR